MSELSVLVVGAGAWGSALANVCARAGTRTWLWDSDEAVMAHLRRTGHHPRFMPDVAFAEGVVPLSDPADAGAVQCVVMVVPFQVLAAALSDLRAGGVETAAIACASKGFELGTRRMAHEIVAASWAAETPFAQLSGPNFAAEVMQGTPAAITIGASTVELGQTLTTAMHSAAFRPYLSDDVIGVEVGGALKNVIAIAAGIADGLALGSNTRAALITRGLAEIARYGCARGGSMETFMGLSGMGDLVLTCTDDQSRNRRFGLALARHGDAARAATEVGALVEGVATTKAIVEMAGDIGIDMPIAAAVAAVLDGTTSPEAAVNSLLSRDPTVENR
ncbi:MAG: NAD(P)H-dependent glycerol-3-phosphate dehydrogenase [Gammaproteobacteria bacterium]